METNKEYQKPYIAGLAMIIISFCIYLLDNRHNDEFGFFSQTFFLNYAVSIIYAVILIVSKINIAGKRPAISYGCWINLVILFTISAFSLNKEMRVFAVFPGWLNVYTVLSIPLFMIYPFYSNLPRFVRWIILFLTGCSLSLSVYMFLYLLPLLPVSCIALLAIGISIHSFVPAFWLYILIDFILKRSKENRPGIFITIGALVPLIILSIYLYKWRSLQIELKDTIAQHNIKLSNQLPDDIYLAQRLPADMLTEEILVSSYKAQRFWGDGMGIERSGGQKYHSPLSTIAIGIFGDVNISESSVENILKIRRDYRHQTTAKLWTDISLSTSAISTNIQLFPEYRMAYHEKTIIIHNDPNKDNNSSWFVTPTQEALYTFHVPEGSIVTSLSLWINGKEQKSRLSTLQKADSAYTNIVGIQRRDPAIVHWKEGNKITVNVFPCTPTEDRKFKIGFTTPLKTTETGLSLENIWFEGPDTRDAREITQIITGGVHLDSTEKFKKEANGNYIYEGDYVAKWRIGLAKSVLSKNTFYFGGNSYQLEEARASTLSMNVKEVFLDINKEWTKSEYEEIVSQLGSKKIYAWVPEKTEINKDNRNLIWENAEKNQFSVPFLYDIEKTEHAVVITKTSHRSPVLEDLKKSNVADSYTPWLTSKKTNLQVLNIGTELSPFWRSMRELRLINYAACTKDNAVNAVLSGQMSYYQEDSSKTVITDSQLAINKTAVTDSTLTGKAPDHLLRVFAYNDLLRKIGRTYFEKEKYENDLFREAEEAYVVTPVTSMIVLESEEDYLRMGIDKNKNTIGNAGVIGGGAVPEPHEWALIFIIAFFILRHLYMQRKLKLAGKL